MEDLLVGVVIVTYNRLECLKKNVAALKALTYQNAVFYIIDNASTDGTDKYCATLDGITYIRLENNLGGSYGFKHGIERAYEDGCDLIWGMDDDAYPQPESLTRMVEAYRQNPHAAYWSNSHSHLPSYQPGYLEPIDHWTFVGFMIDRALIQKVGYPRDDLFIFFDDAEYAKRIIKAGIPIFKVHDAIVIHEGALNKASDDQYFSRPLFGREIKVQKLPDWKLYYLYRNRVLTSYSFLQKGYACKWCLSHAMRFAYVHPAYLKPLRKGIADGLRGVTGKTVNP